MGDVIFLQVYCGILCGPIIVAYGTVVSVLIRRRNWFASRLALFIGTASVVLICTLAIPSNEFDGEIAAGVSFLSFVIGMPIVFIVAMLSGKPIRQLSSIDPELGTPWLNLLTGTLRSRLFPK